MMKNSIENEDNTEEKNGILVCCLVVGTVISFFPFYDERDGNDEKSNNAILVYDFDCVIFNRNGGRVSDFWRKQLYCGT